MKTKTAIFKQKLTKYLFLGVCAFLLFWGAKQQLVSVEAQNLPDCVSTYATSNVCGQQSYDTCNLQYDGNRAYYDCHASQDPYRCIGKIYCSLYDRPFSQYPVYPTNVAPTCDSVRTTTTCGQPTYDTCSGVQYEGNKAYYTCYASQNNNCQGKYYCEPQDRYTAPVPAPIAPPTSGGANANATANCPAGTTPQGTNSQGTLICIANANANSNNNNNTSGSSSAASATGGTAIAYGGAGGSSSVTINNAGGGTNTTREVVREVRVVTAQAQPAKVAGITYVKELPKTGLPALAWTALAFLPAGLRMRKFSKIQKDAQDNPNYLWESREFKR